MASKKVKEKEESIILVLTVDSSSGQLTNAEKEDPATGERTEVSLDLVKFLLEIITGIEGQKEPGAVAALSRTGPIWDRNLVKTLEGETKTDPVKKKKGKPKSPPKV